MKDSLPLRPLDQTARDTARKLLVQSRHAALAVVLPGGGHPMVSRIGLASTGQGAPLTLISDLAAHTAALEANPACSLLVGEPGARGDPLTHPRLTLQAQARFVPRESGEHAALRRRYARLRPKARIYLDFADFRFVVFRVDEAHLNGGFGKAWRLRPEDIAG